MGKRKIKFELLIHDLKGPLAVIETGITFLLHQVDKYGPLTAKQQKVLERTLRNAKVTQHLVNDALEVGKSTEGIINKNEFVLSEFVEETLVEIFDLIDYNTAENIKSCASLSEVKEILSNKDIMLNIDEKIWQRKFLMDMGKMNQIFRNLLNNALKYRKKRIDLKIEDKAGSFLIFVKDDGQGIEKMYQEKIFECYFQMDKADDYCLRGHGLGLAGVMVLVEDMGGKLFLESDVGRGAAFSVEVPL